MTETKRRALSFETVGSIVAMIIGASALFVAWDQAQVMRKQQHASVWPIIASNFVISGDKETRYLEFTVENAGVGPALIESISLKIDGEPKAHWRDLEAALFGTPPKGPMAFSGNDGEGSVLAAGETITVMKGAWGAGEEIDAAFQVLAGKYLGGGAPDVDLEVCYCSVFERCWETRGKSRSVRINRCPAATRFFGGLFTEDNAGAK